MAGQLIEVRQPGRRPLHLLVRDQLEIGRECDGLNLVDDAASRRHARLELVAGELQVADLGSSNGTLVNDQSISGTVVLRPGDVVAIGMTEVELFIDTATAVVAADRSNRETMAPPSSQPTRPTGPRRHADDATMAEPAAPRTRPTGPRQNADAATMAEPRKPRPDPS